MDIKFYKYTLIPKMTLNPYDRGLRHGVLFYTMDSFCDYCPWEEFGDTSVDDMIQQVKKCGYLPDILQKQINLDLGRESVEYKAFFNHGFNSSDCDTIKVKFHLLEKIDLKNVTKIRLDFNNQFSFQGAVNVWTDLPDHIKSKCEYVEDPCMFNYEQWMELSQIGMPLAIDRNLKTNAKDIVTFEIYKPNIDMKPMDNIKTIYSSYMGHDLGRFHCYLELLRNGDLSLCHGIDTPNIFKNQLELFLADRSQRTINQESVRELYQNLREYEWKVLI